MRTCSKCKRNKFFINMGLYLWCSKHFIQVFGKWICSDCLLKSGGSNREAMLKAKSKLRKRMPPKTLEERLPFRDYEKLGKIELRKRWVREDLNRVYESYRVLKTLSSLDLRYIRLARKPKKRQMFWREIVYKRELEK